MKCLTQENPVPQKVETIHLNYGKIAAHLITLSPLFRIGNNHKKETKTNAQISETKGWSTIKNNPRDN